MSLLRVRRFKLVAQFAGDGRRDGMQRSYMYPENNGGDRGGIWIDGVICPLEGQPPRASTNGWGPIPRRWRCRGLTGL